MSRAIFSIYPGLAARSAQDVRRITLTIPREDAELLQTVFGGAGLPTSIAHIAINRICYELRHANISTYNPDAVLSLVAEIRRPTLNGTAPVQPGPDVTRRTRGVRTRVAKKSHATNSPSKGD